VALSSGVYSLIGVAVGSGATWLTQWQIAAWSDRLDARAATRQVRTELAEIRIWVEVIARAPNISSDVVSTLAATPKWRSHADQLARQLSDAEWDAVEAAYSSVEQLAIQSGPGREPGGPVTDDDLKQAARFARTRIDEACACLR
jgi:hypothetical protein